IYRDQLLPYSETFIPAQVSSLIKYGTVYAGSSRITSALDNQQTIVVDELSGRLWKGLYKWGGIVPPDWLAAIRAQRPDMVHAHFGSDGGIVWPVCQRLRIPLIVTCHGYDATWQIRHWTNIRSRNHVFRALLLSKRNLALAKANRIIAVSQFIRDQLLLLGTAEQKVVVHYIGIDRQQFSPQTIQRQPIVLFVGRLVEKKGVKYLIEAMAHIQRQRPDVELVIIGDGLLKAELQTLAEQLSVRVRFLGKQPPEQVRYWMNCAQVFCGPSIVAESGDAEGFGMVFAEAQAMGLPVVSFASGGVPEAVLDGQTGLLAPEKDTPQLTKAIQRLLTDEDLRQKFARAGQAHVAKRFDIHQNTRQLETLYDEVIADYSELR
ncbi:MAG: glycosyltransferase, partial [Leptolyngbyaceae cyanobacterium MAG.088]|nr:glycosyltransferase [Leptolyngbyaceae cyanobacterium MAG.088]